MTIFVFGNPDLSNDSLPLRILPLLRRGFPNINFKIQDPNEDWKIPKEIILIDTILGINGVRVFNDLKYFMNTQRISLHDFDVVTYFRHLKKIGKIQKIKIIGIPPTITENRAFSAVEAILLSSQFSKNAQHNSYKDHRP